MMDQIAHAHWYLMTPCKLIIWNENGHGFLAHTITIFYLLKKEKVIVIQIGLPNFDLSQIGIKQIGYLRFEMDIR